MEGTCEILSLQAQPNTIENLTFLSFSKLAMIFLIVFFTSTSALNVLKYTNILLNRERFAYLHGLLLSRNIAEWTNSAIINEVLEASKDLDQKYI